MAVGMGTVFGFLSIMVAIMYVSAAFFERFDHLFPEPEPAPTRGRASSSNDAEIAVVLAAIAAHRSRG